jgi:hypothetical protein
VLVGENVVGNALAAGGLFKQPVAPSLRTLTPNHTSFSHNRTRSGYSPTRLCSHTRNSTLARISVYLQPPTLTCHLTTTLQTSVVTNDRQDVRYTPQLVSRFVPSQPLPMHLPSRCHCLSSGWSCSRSVGFTTPTKEATALPLLEGPPISYTYCKFAAGKGKIQLA